jgi:hypothetical protein
MRSRSISKLAAALVLASALLSAAMVAGRPAQAQDNAGERDAEETSTLPGPAALAVVSLRDQRISVYDATGRAIRARVSSGQTDYETPVGVYSILQKNRDHYSNLYDDAEMPFMQRLTWSGIALHAGALPGHPASHGCVRLPYDFADRIFGLSKIGTRVIVAGEDVAPSEIDHPALWKPTTPGGGRPATTQIAYTPDEDAAGRAFTPDLTDWPERQALFDRLASAAAAKAIEADAAAPELDELTKARDAKAAAHAKTTKAVKRAETAKQKAERTSASAARRVAETRSDKARKSAESAATKAAEALRKADEKLAAAKALDEAAGAELARATAAFDVADAVKKTARAAADEAKRKTLPMSVFVSLKAQRLYVRQGHEPVLDMPISIAEPEKPIGTHVFTAMDYNGDGNDVRWSVVSLRPRPRLATDTTPPTARKRRAAAEMPPPPTDLGPATAALDRVTLPPEIVARASEYVWPGTSLIISDEELSKETGKATDFVVLISGEPQGGIKKRPRQQPNYRYDPYYYYDDYYSNDRYYNDRRRRPRYTPFFSFW